MKNRIKNAMFLLTLTIILGSCQRKENTSIAPLSEMPVSMAVQKQVGEFMDGDGEKASGNAKILLKDGNYQLFLENLKVNNGPDLYVYLSQEKNPVNFINLGKLKSIQGNQVYDIPANNTVSYKYVLVYCKQYSHLFGFAELK